MPTPTGPVQGLRETIKLQLGVNVAAFGGMNVKNDAGAIPDNAFAHLQNVVWDVGMPVSRPGAETVNTGSPLGIGVIVEGIFDAGDIGAAE